MLRVSGTCPSDPEVPAPQTAPQGLLRVHRATAGTSGPADHHQHHGRTEHRGPQCPFSNTVIRSWKKPEKRVLTYFAKYLNILCHLSLDTLPFMLTYFFGGVLRQNQGIYYLIT